MKKLFMFIGLVLSFYANACQQETFIIDGQVVVCSICGGVMVCDKEKLWKN
jgi:hypothetical protein